MTQKEIDNMLALAIRQARDLGIPVARNISPHVELNFRAKNRFGCCIHRPSGPVIELNAKLAMEGSRDAIMQVLVHEVLHTCPTCSNHDYHWQYYAYLMNQRYGYNVQRTDNFKNLGIEDDREIKYWVICNRCGKRFARLKRSAVTDYPERYRCQCGGTLRVEKAAPGTTR